MEEKEKVLHIVEAFGGGIFSFLVDLINETANKYDIVVAYGERNETFDKFKKYFSDKIKFIKVENFARAISPIKDLKAFFEIRKIIEKENPDIIHLHSSKAGFIGRFAVNCNKYKMFYNPHGYSFLMEDCSKLKRKIYWLLEKVGATRNCKIVGCSYGEYEESLKLTSNSICINNGINIDNLEKNIKSLKAKQIDFNDLKICTSGRIGHQKNPKLFNEIAEKFPNIQFTWIGEGDLKDELTGSNIKITGWLEKNKVLKELNKNDIFILTSLWEGLPISLLEAMYMKKVCIVSNVIGNKDVIKNSENGFVCNNIKEFEKTIENILDNKYNLENISKNAYEDVVQNYNIKDMCKKYIEIYKG